ncbi:COMM domain-containing protein 1 isoform X1 [Cyanistes caeruleus]|uniref:COMM domain-containing protein 1 isoform X1 n=1 Tax=Cyanistes caeruleus TaxID=156563 RepID=UPI000CDB34E7|nr:COMM domain-containing protein 1 isoform X1 [Cyanistes caeruleus]
MDSNQLEAFLTAQTKKQGGITSDQAAVIAKFWKNHRTQIHESLINQSRWDNVLKNMNWRVDLKSQLRHIDQMNTPVAIVEMELGKNGQSVEADPPRAFHSWISAVTNTIMVCGFRFFPNLKEVEFSAQDLKIKNDCVLLAANGKRLL